MWCARLPITHPDSIVVLLPSDGGDQTPPLSTHGITPQRLPVSAASGGVTLAAWLERVTAGSAQWTGPAPPPNLWWRRRHPQAPLPGPRVQGERLRGVPAHPKHGPVALWWCHRGKSGDLRVAFFLCVRPMPLAARPSRAGKHHPAHIPRPSHSGLQ